MISDRAVAACIVNWNTAEDTIECLESLMGGSVRPHLIVIVDNGSTDNSVDRIEDWAHKRYQQDSILVDDSQWTARGQGHTNVKFALVCGYRNEGFAAGANRAKNWATSIGSFEFLWFLNSDTVVEPEALEALLICMEGDSNTGVLGSTVVFDVSPETVQCAGGCTYSWWTTVIRHRLQGWPVSKAMRAHKESGLDYVYGASMFIRSGVFDIVGCFNEDYFMYYEELDLCNRIRSKGFEIGWCKEAVVKHKGGESVKRTSDDLGRQKMFANYHETLSTLTYTKQYHPYGLIVVMVSRLFGKLAVLAIRRDWYLIPVLGRAYVDFLLGVNKRERA